MALRQAKVFWTGRSQAVRLPKDFRFETDTVSVRREGQSIVLEPLSSWPKDYVKSFAGVVPDFTRAPQRKVDKRKKIG